MNNTPSWREEFDKEFTFKGHFGEQKLTYIRTQNYTKSTPVVLDDKVIEDLKAFIEKVSKEERQRLLETLEKEVEGLKIEWIRQGVAHDDEMVAKSEMMQELYERGIKSALLAKIKDINP